MNRLMVVLCCVLLSACGGSSVTRPALILNAENYMNEAIQAYADEQWNRAQQLFERSLINYQSMDDRLGVLVCHINLVEVALAGHVLALAEKHLALADAMLKTEALPGYQARINLLYALVAMQQDKMIAAHSFLQSVLPDFQLTAFTVDAVQLAAIASRTQIAFVQKQNESLWTSRFENALEKSVPANQAMQARLIRFQARLLMQTGDYAKAEALFQQALLIYKADLSRSGIAQVLFELGTLSQQQSAKAQAINYFNRAIAVFQSLGQTEKVNKIKQSLGKVQIEQL